MDLVERGLALRLPNVRPHRPHQFRPVLAEQFSERDQVGAALLPRDIDPGVKGFARGGNHGGDARGVDSGCRLIPPRMFCFKIGQTSGTQGATTKLCTQCMLGVHSRTVQKEPPSLREAKRRATLHAIEEHATLLVLEHGYEAVTVEDICAAAEVSRRTFFNYVESKEIAVFGRPARLPPPEVQQRFLHTTHTDLVAAVVDTLFDAFVAEHDGQLLRRRKIIRRAHPALSYTRFAQSHEIHQEVVEMMTRYLDAHPHQRRLTGPAGQEAHAVVTLAGAAVQLGMRQWMTGTDSTVEGLRGSVHQALRDIRAIEKE